MAASSSCATSRNVGLAGPLAAYPLVAFGPAPVMEKPSGVARTMLDLFVNTLQLRAKETQTKGRTYHIGVDGLRTEVYSVSKNGSRRVELGLDPVQGVWYTGYEKGRQFCEFLQKFPRLTDAEMARLPLQMRSDLETEPSPELLVEMPEEYQQIGTIRDLGLTILQNLRFVPSHIAFQEKDRAGFASLPRTHSQVQPKNVPDDLPTETLPDFFASLLRVNRGLFLGISFPDFPLGLPALLIDQLPSLYRVGVRHLYDEMPVYPGFPIYEKFNSEPGDAGEELQVYLDEMLHPNAEGAVEVYQEARRLGIQVWPIGGGLFETEEQSELGVGDDIAVRNIDYFTSRLEGKFLCLHDTTHHGVAEQEGIPHVRFQCEMRQDDVGEYVDRVARVLEHIELSEDELKLIRAVTKGVGHPLYDDGSELSSIDDDDDELSAGQASSEPDTADFIVEYRAGYKDKEVRILPTVESLPEPPIWMSNADSAWICGPHFDFGK